jgi:hypothetical protein
MIRKASARSIRNMPRHGHNEQEALERMARNGFGDTGSNREVDKQRASVSGIGNQSKLLYLSQIS